MTLTTQERKDYLNKKGVAGYCLSNYGGIEIKDILYGIEDFVVFTYYDIPKIYIRKIYNSIKRGPYFRFGVYRVYLDECMRF